MSDDKVFDQMKSDKKLLQLMKLAQGYEMTPEEYAAQRKSFVKGQVMLANPDMTENEFEKLYEDVVKLVGPGQPRKSP
jgi:t-SNARE complex subunit (syntaxin)